MDFDSSRMYVIDEDRKPPLDSFGFVADGFRKLKTMVEVENMNCYGKLTHISKNKNPAGFELDNDGLYWSCFYEVQK